MLLALIKIAVLVFVLMTATAYLVLLERWVAAWVQDRVGPNRVGIPLTKVRLWGLGQPLADGVKMLLKEQYVPSHVDKFLYTLAPISIMASALALFAVVPFGTIDLGGGYILDLVVAPGIDVGLIYIFALSSVGVYGVILGGWASNNKYSFLGALRSSAQLIAYEIPLGLGILGVILMSNSLRLEEVVNQQAELGVWFAFLQPIGFLVFLVAACAEAGRLPFDLPEAEQELVCGYHTEYSGMRLVMYASAEFIHMITAAVLIVLLFLGGWHFWGITGSEPVAGLGLGLVRLLILLGKIFLVIFLFMMVRWSWPRFRFDQLMSLAWKVMLPLGIVNLVVVAVAVEYFNDAIHERPWLTSAVMWAIAIVVWVVTAIVNPRRDDTNLPRLNDELYRPDELGPPSGGYATADLTAAR